MDFLNLMIGFEERLGVTVPQRDDPALATLDGCLAYLRRHGAGVRSPEPDGGRLAQAPGRRHCTTRVPCICCGWTSQRNRYRPGLRAPTR